MSRLITLLLTASVTLVPQLASAQGLPEPTKQYLKRFAIEAPFTTIIEYVDDSYTSIEGQRVFKSSKPFRRAGGAKIALQGLELNLFGLSACPSETTIQAYIYDGKCSDALPTYIDTELSLSPILICRVFMKYANEALQDATCWTLFSVGGKGVIHNMEGALLETGAGFLTRDQDGNVLRPDLIPFENYAREKNTLIWSDGAKRAMGFDQ